MKVYVLNHYTDKTRLYEGTPQVIEQQLLIDYPFLRAGALANPNDLEGTLEHLEATQAYSVTLDDGEPLEKSDPNLPVGPSSVEEPVVQDMLGFSPHFHQAIEAARFLAGGEEVSLERIRRALFDEDGDFEAAALRAYGFPVSDENRVALRAIVGMGAARKAEPATVVADSVVAALPDGEDVAEAIRRAYKDSFVYPVQLAGKHSGGSLLARDEASHSTWLLKPGSGKQSPAAGAAEETSSQSAREAAWYHVAKNWGLWDAFPRAELVLIDGRQYAALELLPWSFATIERRRKGEPNIARKVLQPYLKEGDLHKWAVIDFVLGNPDRHGQNVMVDDRGAVRLIDHGSAFAGHGFDPAKDQNSFVPYYLRAWAPQTYNSLHPDEKLTYLPRIAASVEKNVRAWFDGLTAKVLEAILYRYGINPEPSLARLARLKELATRMPIDEAINRLWVTV